MTEARLGQRRLARLARTNARWIWWLRRRSLREDSHSSLLFSRRHRRLCCGTGCMVRPQSLMSKLSPSCGGVGHAFMEFLKVPGDYCQAQHDLHEEKWTVEIHHCSTKKPHRSVTLDTDVCSWNHQSLLQEFQPGWGKPRCSSFPLTQSYWTEGWHRVRRFISLLLPISYLKHWEFRVGHIGVDFSFFTSFLCSEI